MDPTVVEGDAKTEIVASLRRSPPPPPEAPGTRFANYELIERLAQGGMGVVYKARDVGLGRVIALKVILTGRFATEAEIARFRHEAEAAANLDHPNIVPIHEIDEHEGWPYFTMKFIEGGSLANHIARFRRDPRLAARMMATVAGAVHYGHRRGVLHRDLKPHNILIDEHGQPHVADFGVAKRLEDDAQMTQTGTVIGTPAYMSPEQAAGKTKEITVAADVYSLGAILYEILTGRPPFDGESPVEVLRAVIENEPVPPRQIDARIDRDLETICLKCLDKDRRQRYRSAEELEQELNRWCCGELIRARPVGRAARVARWIRRNPVFAGGAVGTMALIIATVIVALGVARQREAQVLDEVRRGNLWSARTAAISYLWQLEQFSLTVERLAIDPQLVERLRRNDVDGARAWLHDVSQRHGLSEGFESWLLLDGVGITIDRFPPMPELIGRRFDQRDYVVGALRHAGEHGHGAIHVSRVFKSEADGLYKFAISAPIGANETSDAKPLGVIVATIAPASTIGSLRLNDERRVAALAGRIDPSSVAEGAARDEASYWLLVHPAYHRRDEAVEVRNARLLRMPEPRVDAPELQLVEPTEGVASTGLIDDHFADPMSARDPRYAGRWLAAFAPVGNTPLVVIVQQRYDAVIRPDRALTRNLALAAGTALTIGILFAAAVAWYGTRAAVGG
jgi:serine/threonine-protein kinase